MSAVDREVILITGGGRGIGAAIAKRLAGKDRIICINYNKDAASAKKTAGEIKENGCETAIFKADISDAEGAERMFKDIIDKYSRVDALINNASPSLKHENIQKLSWNDFQAQIDVIVKGAFNCSVEAIKSMKKNKKGHIVNILTSSVIGRPPAGMAHYVTAKYALMGLSRTLGIEVAKFNIRLNMVSPYLTRTDLVSFMNERHLEILEERHPMGRLARPQDTAEAVAFLLSDGASYINFANIPVTGGAVS